MSTEKHSTLNPEVNPEVYNVLILKSKHYTTLINVYIYIVITKDENSALGLYISHNDIVHVYPYTIN